MNETIVEVHHNAVVKFQWLSLKLEGQQANCHNGNYYHMNRNQCKFFVNATPNSNAAPSNWCVNIEYIHVCQVPRGYNNPSEINVREDQIMASINLTPLCNRQQLNECERCEGRFMFHIRLGSTPLLVAENRFTDPQKSLELNSNCRIFLDNDRHPIFVNRELLSVYCTVFRRMFESDFKEKNADEVKISELSKDDFLAFLSCLYHPPAPVTKKNLSSVLLVADRFDCKVLMQACEHFLKNNLPHTEEDYKSHVHLADRHSFKDLLKETLQRASTDVLTEFLNPSFLDLLSPETVREIHQMAYDKLRQNKTGTANKGRR